MFKVQIILWQFCFWCYIVLLIFICGFNYELFPLIFLSKNEVIFYSIYAVTSFICAKFYAFQFLSSPPPPDCCYFFKRAPRIVVFPSIIWRWTHIPLRNSAFNMHCPICCDQQNSLPLEHDDYITTTKAITVLFSTKSLTGCFAAHHKSRINKLEVFFISRDVTERRICWSRWRLYGHEQRSAFIQKWMKRWLYDQTVFITSSGI
jgi:hypothetical protein